MQLILCFIEHRAVLFIYIIYVQDKVVNMFKIAKIVCFTNFIHDYFSN